MSKSYKTFSDWLNDQSESVQKRMEMISGALAWDQALLHSEHVKQLEASHRIKMENGNQPVNAQLLAALKDVLPPYEPTKEMVEAARAHHEGEHYLPYSLYRAMLAAAKDQP